MNTGNFSFGPGNSPGGPGSISIPPALKGKLALFAAYRECFPISLRDNWGSLFDRIRDFSWLKERDVTISHADFPELEHGDCVIYAEILNDAVVFWRDRGDRRLIVRFPESCRAVIDAL